VSDQEGTPFPDVAYNLGLVALSTVIAMLGPIAALNLVLPATPSG
jgi:hypothetical protein